jgi:hypothetical protein
VNLLEDLRLQLGKSEEEMRARANIRENRADYLCWREHWLWGIPTLIYMTRKMMVSMLKEGQD